MPERVGLAYRGFPETSADVLETKAEIVATDLQHADPFLQRLLNSCSSEDSRSERKFIKDRLEEMADDATDVRPPLPIYAVGLLPLF